MIRLYKNNNLHIKLEKDDLRTDIIETLYLNYDLVPESEEYYISNYATASDWSYNGGYAYYKITSYDLYNLANNKTVILQPLDEAYINEYILNDEY